MEEIVNRLHENRQIELAKEILESAGYEVSKRLNEDFRGRPLQLEIDNEALQKQVYNDLGLKQPPLIWYVGEDKYLREFHSRKATMLKEMNGVTSEQEVLELCQAIKDKIVSSGKFGWDYQDIVSLLTTVKGQTRTTQRTLGKEIIVSKGPFTERAIRAEIKDSQSK